MRSDAGITLYSKLSEVAALAENLAGSGSISELGELSVIHAGLISQIRNTDPLYSEELVAAIKEANIRMDSAISAIRKRQNDIINELSASSNKDLLNRAYGK